MALQYINRVQNKRHRAVLLRMYNYLNNAGAAPDNIRQYLVSCGEANLERVLFALLDFANGTLQYAKVQQYVNQYSDNRLRFVLQAVLDNAVQNGYNLNLSFVSQVYTTGLSRDPVTFDSMITFTRSSSGTHFDSTGRLVTDSNNVARFDYDPATLLPRGLLIEAAATNLLLHSLDMTQAAWSKTDVTAARTQVGIDGVANSACLMTEGSAGTANTRQNGSAVTAGSVVTASIVAKRGNTDWIRFLVGETTLTDYGQAYFNLNTGVKGFVGVIGAATGVSSSITNLGGGWYRLSITVTPNGTFTVPAIYFQSATADATNTRVANATYIVYCAQLEVGSAASSIIITGAASASRAADVSPMTGTNFSSWFNQSAGTFVVEYFTNDSTGSGRGVISANDGTAANKLDMRSVGNASVGSSASVNQWAIGGSATTGIVNKVATAYATNDIAAYRNGVQLGTDTVATLPTVTQLQIGGLDGTSAFNLNGHIRSIRYYSTRLPNSVLQSLTT